MPNQRRKGKKTVTVWLTPEEREQLHMAVKESGCDLSTYIKNAIESEIKARGENESDK